MAEDPPSATGSAPLASISEKQIQQTREQSVYSTCHQQRCFQKDGIEKPQQLHM